MVRSIRAAAMTAAAEAGGFLLALSAGFFLSGSKIAGVASFADISLAGALTLPGTAAVLSGSLAYSVIFGDVGRSIVKLSAMIMIIIMKLFFNLEQQPKACGTVTGLSVFLSGMAVSALIGDMLYKLLFYAFYGTVAGFTSYSAAVILAGISRRSVIDLTGRGGCAYAAVYTVIVSTLCSVDVPFVQPGLVLGIGVALYAAHFYGYTGGVMCGALTVCGAFLAASDHGLSIVLLPATALITGYAKRERAAVSALIFVVSQLLLTVLTGLANNYTESIPELLCGASLFILTAAGWSDKWIIAGRDSSESMGELISSRMSFLSDTIGSVRGECQKIAEVLSDNSRTNSESETVSGEVCGHCVRRLSCWKKYGFRTRRGFEKLSGMSPVTPADFPEELSDCLRKHEISERMEELARERAASKLLQMRFGEGQRVMFEQMSIMEELMESAGERINVRYSEAVSRQIRDKLSRFGISCRSAIAYYNSRNRLNIELYFRHSDRPAELSRVCDLISDELHIPLDCSEPIDSGREVRARLYERPEYAAEVWGTSKSAGGEGENGDTWCCFTDGSGVSYVVLSDGMGSGRGAAVESRLVVRMFRRLITSGVELCSAIRLINSIMLTKSPEESFATLDVLRIDLDTCEATVVKSGATSTLIRHRDSVLKISSPTFPVGIYENSDIFCRKYELDEGDAVVMFSDGISENEYLYIKELLLQKGGLMETVGEVCRKSGVFCPQQKPDDVTVIGVRLNRSN